MMKDQILLLITGSVVAIISWVFWYFLGEASFIVFTIIVMLVLSVDNMRLRRKLRARQLSLLPDGWGIRKAVRFARTIASFIGLFAGRTKKAATIEEMNEIAAAG